AHDRAQSSAPCENSQVPFRGCRACGERGRGLSTLRRLPRQRIFRVTGARRGTVACVASSLLAAAGLSELITDSLDNYEALALRSRAMHRGLLTLSIPFQATERSVRSSMSSASAARSSRPR